MLVFAICDDIEGTMRIIHVELGRDYSQSSVRRVSHRSRLRSLISRSTRGLLSALFATRNFPPLKQNIPIQVKELTSHGKHRKVGKYLKWQPHLGHVRTYSSHLFSNILPTSKQIDSFIKHCGFMKYYYFNENKLSRFNLI